MSVLNVSCGAAHSEDPRPCEGPVDAVRVVDRVGSAVSGCLLHGAVLLASLDDGRVYPLNGPAGSAIAVYLRARSLRPFDFLDSPWSARRPSSSSARPRRAR